MELKATVSMKGAIFDGTAPKIIHEKLLSAMYEATQFLERKVKEKTPYRTGHLRSTIFGEVVKYGTPVTGLVGHTCKYGDPVEWGTGIYGPKRMAYTITTKTGKKVTRKGMMGSFMFAKTFNNDWAKVTEIFDRMGFDIAAKLSEDKS